MTLEEFSRILNTFPKETKVEIYGWDDHSNDGSEVEIIAYYPELKTIRIG